MKFVVGKSDEIPPGSRKIVRVAGRSIGVFNVGGEYFAIRNRCPHQGAPLCEGKLWGALKSDVPGSFEYNETKDILACIQHGWEFSVRTGQSWCDPKRLRVRAYTVAVEQPEAVAPDLPTATPDRVKNRMILTANPTPTEVADPGTRAAHTDGPDATPPAEDPDAPAPGMVKGPYAVETFPVSVESGYLYLVVDVVDVASSAAARR
jgi:nitrite reductase/ring-hydroxylating ferredoxin subunit